MRWGVVGRAPDGGGARPRRRGRVPYGDKESCKIAIQTNNVEVDIVEVTGEARKIANFGD
jgi:hypothetical protein